MLEIKSFISLSLVDWDKKLSAVLFLPGCNMRCPFCYNAELVLRPEKLEAVPFDKIQNYLEKSRGWIEGVVLLGGEPTLHKELPDLCRKLKKLELLVKLDTNGTNPAMIRKLIGEGLVDYVALDVKAPLSEKKYSRVAGVNVAGFLDKIEETIDMLLADNVNYEFRTTLVPTLHTVEDTMDIGKRIKGCKKYVLQQYRVYGETIDPEFQKLKPFTINEMEKFLSVAKKWVPNTMLRGV